MVFTTQLIQNFSPLGDLYFGLQSFFSHLHSHKLANRLPNLHYIGIFSKSSSATFAKASKRFFNVLCRGHSTAYSYLEPVC